MLLPDIAGQNLLSCPRLFTAASPRAPPACDACGAAPAGRHDRAPAGSRADAPAPPAPSSRPAITPPARSDGAGRDQGPRLATCTAVAGATGWPPARLEQVLTTDDTAWVAETGRCSTARSSPSSDDRQRGPPPAAARRRGRTRTTQTFTLHSRPGASRRSSSTSTAPTSATPAGTAPAGDRSNGTHTGFDRDGNPEHLQHRRARLHPGGLAPGRRDLRPLRRRRHHRRTPASQAHPLLDRRHDLRHPRPDHQRPRPRRRPLRAAASASPGSAPSTTSTRSATTSRRGSSPRTSFDPMIVAQAASHETGHTLGLSHDGTSDRSATTRAPRPGARSWAPR